MTQEWQWAVSEWLVASGCLNMAAWGLDCSSWDDSVDLANLEAFDFEVPEDRFVMTSWHANNTLEEAVFFAKHCAFHSTVALTEALILDISLEDHEAEVLALWARL